MPIPDRTDTQRPTWTLPARRGHPVFNLTMAILCAVLAYAGLTTPARTPEFGSAIAEEPVETATLTFSGKDVIVTGSLGHMFETLGTFVGPNRAEKVDRARKPVDVIALARGFESVRLQLASLRSGPADPTDLPHSSVGSTEVAAAPAVEEEPKISVAAIDPSLISSSSALTAIDALTYDPNAPVPLALSQATAYARANTPMTDFTVVRNAAGQVVSEKELWCLATAIYFESRGESYRGQVAVAQVVLNRLKHPIYPKTICGVVFQNQNRRNACQFSFACDGIPERVTDNRAWAQAEEIAEGAVRGNLYLTEVGHATHYHATYVYPHWAPRMKKVTKIGLHVFYQFKAGWRFG